MSWLGGFRARWLVPVLFMAYAEEQGDWVRQADGWVATARTAVIMALAMAQMLLAAAALHWFAMSG